jgi:hypothetical protein
VSTRCRCPDGKGKRPLFSSPQISDITRRLAALVPSIYSRLQPIATGDVSTDGRHSLTIRWHLPRVGAARVATRARPLPVDQRPLGIVHRMSAGCARRLRRYRLDRRNPLHRRPRHWAILARMPCGAIVVGVRFHPGAASAWLGQPLGEIVNVRVPLAEFWGDDATRLLDRAAAGRSAKQLAEDLAVFLVGRLAAVGRNYLSLNQSQYGGRWTNSFKTSRTLLSCPGHHNFNPLKDLRRS